MCDKNGGAKPYLQKIRLYDIRIDNMIDEKSRLMDLITRITPTYAGEAVSGGSNQDKLGDTIAKIVDMEADIDRRIDTLCDMKQTAMRMIDRLQNPNHVKILYKRYFQYKTLEQISVEMGYSYRNICYIHGKALQELSKLMNETEDKT